MATALSPSSSPRLPSPPPFAEDQIGPTSPTGRDTSAGGRTDPAGQTNNDTFAARRIRPGTRATEMASGPPLVPLEKVGPLSHPPYALKAPQLTPQQLDSPFQLQEHLKALHHHLTHPPDSDHNTPITRRTAHTLAQPPPNVERSLWLYELCRFLTMRLNTILTHLFADTPSCSAQTCPEMRASEWQYLCAVHDPPKSCCAIDYCCHTLDWAGNMLTSPKHFPSRLTLGSESGGSQQGVRQLTNVFRRLYRIFAHAWFQHRHVFWEVEGDEGLYVFFKTVCDDYNLVPEDNYTIPPDAEGVDSEDVAASAVKKQEEPTPSILKKGKGEAMNVESEKEHETGASTTTTATGATTRWHRATPSSGSSFMAVLEEAEEEHQQPQAAKDASSFLAADLKTTKLADEADEEQAEAEEVEHSEDQSASNVSAAEDVEKKTKAPLAEEEIKPDLVEEAKGQEELPSSDPEDSPETKEHDPATEDTPETENPQPTEEQPQSESHQASEPEPEPELKPNNKSEVEAVLAPEGDSASKSEAEPQPEPEQPEAERPTDTEEPDVNEEDNKAAQE
ncbi:MAG: hypothetical protein M1819_003305 [Sarea resinae]|nr:MAG: hypothetical protein M1819_003305 [Sarea resinae]